MAFMKVIEERIDSGDLLKNFMDVQIQGNAKFRPHHDLMADEVFRKSREKPKELQKILGKITSLRNGRGGDQFFKGLAKTFQTNPIIPPVHFYTNYDHLIADEDLEDTVMNSPVPTIGSRGQTQSQMDRNLKIVH
jgi:hypothetical protein